MLTVKPVYKLFNVSDDLKWTTNTHVTPFSPTFKVPRITNNSYGFGRLFAPSFFIRPPIFLPVQMTGGRVST